MVPCSYLGLQPCGERLTDHGRSNVHKPLLGKFSDLLCNWKVLEAAGVLVEVVLDVLNCKAIVLWAEDVVDVAALDI